MKGIIIGSGKNKGLVAALLLLFKISIGKFDYALPKPDHGVVAATSAANHQDRANSINSIDASDLIKHHRTYAHVKPISILPPNRPPDHVAPVLISKPANPIAPSYSQTIQYSPYPQQLYSSYFRPQNWRNWRWRRPSRPARPIRQRVRNYSQTRPSKSNTRRRYYASANTRPVRFHGK